MMRRNVGHHAAAPAFLSCMLVMLISMGHIGMACSKLIGISTHRGSGSGSKPSGQGRLLQSQLLSQECLDSIQDPSYIGDGYCDSVEGGYNTAACNYDGGDCCLETCVDATYICKGAFMECQDPSPGIDTDEAAAGRVDGDEDESEPSVSPECLDLITNSNFLGDGFCDDNQEGYNTEECNYDGGDCCPETCVDGEYVCKPSFMVCLDPNNTPASPTSSPSIVSASASPTLLSQSEILTASPSLVNADSNRTRAPSVIDLDVNVTSSISPTLSLSLIVNDTFVPTVSPTTMALNETTSAPTFLNETTSDTLSPTILNETNAALANVTFSPTVGVINNMTSSSSPTISTVALNETTLEPTSLQGNNNETVSPTTATNSSSLVNETLAPSSTPALGLRNETTLAPAPTMNPLINNVTALVNETSSFVPTVSPSISSNETETAQSLMPTIAANETLINAPTNSDNATIAPTIIIYLPTNDTSVPTYNNNTGESTAIIDIDDDSNNNKRRE